MPNRPFPEIFPVSPKRDTLKAIAEGLAYCSLTIFLSSQAMAQEVPDAQPLTVFGQKASATLGVGADYGPAYEGAKKNTVTPIPYVDVKLFNDRVFLSSTQGLGANIVNLGPFQAGLAVTYGAGRTSKDSPRLTGLKDLPGAVAAAGFMKYNLKPFSFEIAAKNYFGPNPGTEVSFGTKYAFAPISRLHISIGPQVTWADSRYDKAHFGVSAAEAAQATAQGNPLQAYSPGSGIKDVGLSMTGIYQIAEHWEGITHIGLSELVGNPAKNSPLTQRDFQPSLAFGVAYKF